MVAEHKFQQPYFLDNYQLISTKYKYGFILIFKIA